MSSYVVHIVFYANLIVYDFKGDVTQKRVDDVDRQFYSISMIDASELLFLFVLAFNQINQNVGNDSNHNVCGVPYNTLSKTF